MELAEVIKDIVSYKGAIVNDLSRPDGSPRKLIDSTKIFEMGWHPRVTFREGMERTYEDYVKYIERYLTRS